MGPDRNTHLRNFAILMLLAVAVWQLPGRRAPRPTSIDNILGLIFAGGLVFFGYRMYMEHRSLALHARGQGARAALRLGRADRARARSPRRRLWDEGGLGVLVWLALIGAGVYGCVTVYRTSREY